MFQLFTKLDFDWLGNRKYFIMVSAALMLAGLASAIIRQAAPGGTEPFNLGVDFKGGTVLIAKFKTPPTAQDLRTALSNAGVRDATIQPSTSKPDEFLIKLPLEGPSAKVEGADKAQVDAGRTRVIKALNTFGKEATTNTLAEDPNAAYKIIGTEAVGPIAGSELRKQAVAVTLLALVGILLYIAFRFQWTYGAGAVIAVFHDVLVTLALFSIFQWEVNLTVVAALLTIVGFSVNDSIVIFDRIRENLKLRRHETLYDITNESVNQTMSRTVITGGLVFLSTLALVLFGGEVLRSFSIALLIGVVFGTYSTIAIASPIMVWWQQKVDAASAKAKVVTQNRPSTARKTDRRTRTAKQV